MCHDIPDPLAPFVHRAGQFDRFRQFTQIQFRSGSLAESHRVQLETPQPGKIHPVGLCRLNRQAGKQTDQ